LNLPGLRHLQAAYMVNHLGLPLSVLRTGFDKAYVDRTVEMLKDSSLDGAVILAHELPYTEDGVLMDGIMPFYTPNDYVVQIAAVHTSLLPAVSIHPARKDALDELDRFIAQGVRVMKCLPNCQNIDCNNPRYRPYWEKMAAGKMFLLAHSGGELSLPVVNRAYEDPRTLRLPLECGVTVIAAHIASNSLPMQRDYFPEFVQMLGTYPNLYGDISALNTPFRSKHLKLAIQMPEIHDRLIYGSDAPIPISALWVALRGLISWRQYREIDSNPNVIERDCAIKRAIGFPDSIFTKLDELLRR